MYIKRFDVLLASCGCRCFRFSRSAGALSSALFRTHTHVAPEIEEQLAVSNTAVVVVVLSASFAQDFVSYEVAPLLPSNYTITRWDMN